MPRRTRRDYPVADLSRKRCYDENKRKSDRRKVEYVYTYHLAEGENVPYTHSPTQKSYVRRTYYSSGSKGITTFLKRTCNRRLRRTPPDVPIAPYGGYKRHTEYWWELF